ncbi:MAG TPA: hypothetical protein VFG86_16820 [Chloroflexota bacterium]|nr:hypothetical protein [Chloroflexota bacterium]
MRTIRAVLLGVLLCRRPGLVAALDDRCADDLIYSSAAMSHAPGWPGTTAAIGHELPRSVT